jgi:hypothetical protein
LIKLASLTAQLKTFSKQPNNPEIPTPTEPIYWVHYQTHNTKSIENISKTEPKLHLATTKLLNILNSHQILSQLQIDISNKNNVKLEKKPSFSVPPTQAPMITVSTETVHQEYHSKTAPIIH